MENLRVHYPESPKHYLCEKMDKCDAIRDLRSGENSPKAGQSCRDCITITCCNTVDPMKGQTGGAVMVMSYNYIQHAKR